VSHLTCADFLRAPGVQTPVIVRFSTVIHERGSPETLRDPRGFAVKFYTREGNFDMVGNNMPVSAVLRRVWRQRQRRRQQQDARRATQLSLRARGQPAASRATDAPPVHVPHTHARCAAQVFFVRDGMKFPGA
jgi:hypothetical protein